MINIAINVKQQEVTIENIQSLNHLELDKNGDKMKIISDNNVINIDITGTQSRTVSVSFEDLYNHLASL